LQYEALSASWESGTLLELLVDDSGNKSQGQAPKSFATAYLELLDRFRSRVREAWRGGKGRGELLTGSLELLDRFRSRVRGAWR
jgi:hypothetical protein